jgi:EmrB/QacA subfamily drug resistance transporter
MHTLPPPGTAIRNHRATTAVVCLALATVVSAMASLNVALPGIARETHASQSELAWVIDAYSLVFASLLLPAGALGDRFGRRRMLLAGLTIFGVGSAIAMTASSAGELIALRAVLGVGAALVMPATLSTITSTFPVRERTRAVAVWAGVAGGSAVVGLLVTGLLLQVSSWPSVFGLNVVLAILAIGGTLRRVPESAAADAPRLDLGGALLATAGLVALVYSVIEAPGAGWLAGRTLGGLAIGAVMLGCFVLFELRRPHPMLDPRLFRNARFTAGCGTILVQFFVFFGFIFVFLQYLQLVRGDSALLAATSMLPMAATLMPASRLAPLLVARAGTRVVCVVGLLLVACGLAVLATLAADTSYLVVLAGLMPLGAGMGLAMTPATSTITEALPASQQGVGSAMNDLSRELGGALGIAVLGSILAAAYRSHLSLPGLPAQVIDRARSSVAVAQQLGGHVRIDAQGAFVSGMHVALLAGAVVAFAAAILVGVLLRPSTSPSRVPEAEAA